MLRLLEHYVSVQGEGPRVGVPTQFVRFAGCNLKCPGWPCDTPHAIDPKLYTKEQKKIELRLDGEDGSPGEGLIASIVAKRDQADNACFTGGEPLLQNNDELYDLAMSLTDNWDMSVEMFTNGTIAIPQDLLEVPVGFIMDWKLAGSGDFDETRYGEVRYHNLNALAEGPYSIDHAVKFVCKSLVDLKEAVHVYHREELKFWPGTVYFGVVWGSEFKESDLVEYLLEQEVPAWKLNMQTHNYIYPPHERRR